jgi:LPXTG-motif cell wall-anchored protein
MKRLLAPLVSIVVMATAAPLAADIDNPYLRPLPPNILGTVTSSTSHSVTVATVEGEAMTFAVDSRTVLPRDLPNGTRVRIEYHTMEPGDHQLAKRVTPFTGEWPEAAAPVGVIESDSRIDNPGVTSVYTREHEHGEPMASAQSTDAGTTTDTPSENYIRSDASTRSTYADDDPDDLPRTASVQPLLAWLGMIALGSGAGLWVSRRRRKA